jgi:hypothetical protein
MFQRIWVLPSRVLSILTEVGRDFDGAGIPTNCRLCAEDCRSCRPVSRFREGSGWKSLILRENGDSPPAGPERAALRDEKETAMKRNLVLLATLVVLAAIPVAAQQGSGAGGGPGSGRMNGTGPQVDVTKPSTVFGDVVSLKGGPGLGMPTLTVRVGGQESSYVLGPYRFLTAQKFAPVAGDAVRLLLYSCDACPQGAVVAEVENLTQKTTLKLRNADGTPAFAGRMGGRGAGCCGGQGAGPMDGTGPNPNCPK